MATLSYEIIATSKPFRFLVGPDKKEYMMHSNLVASMSKVLDTLVNGSMKEASEGVVEWPNVDESTFLSFCQFAYTRDYQIDNSVPADALEENPQRGGREACESYSKPGTAEWQCVPPSTQGGLFGSNVHAIEAPRKRIDLWKKFIHESGLKTSELTTKKDSSVDCVQDLLAHARVYTMADYYDIPSLAIASSNKIHRILATLQLDNFSINQLNYLIPFIYDNTADRECRLRAILCLFAASKLKDLWPSKAFQEALINIGEFSWGVIGHIVTAID